MDLTQRGCEVSYAPSSEAQALMHKVCQGIHLLGTSLGGRFEFYTPYVRFRKHADESLAVLKRDGTSLTGQDTAILIRYYRGGVRIIPLENYCPKRLLNPLMQWNKALVVSPKPFFPNTSGKQYTRRTDLWGKRTWRDLLPPSALHAH